ncbi:hypothetical protein [Methanosarcina horonobensis]|uniref:hypothetical protein n=1 Tax=Methanosarcina horonobensis TaxID=418008 RepID=UPI000B217857|nr:hypothetical protein [Methanosarcina horonobensis]
MRIKNRFGRPFFCSGCGNRIKNKPDTDNSKYEIRNFKSENSTSRELDYAKALTSFFDFRRMHVQNFVLKGIWTVALICVLGVLLTAYSTFALESGKSPEAGIPNSQEKVQADKNIRLCEQIAADYCNSHTYSKDDIYDCDNMAQDIWNMLKAKGINARIAVGSFDSAGNNRIANGNTVHKGSGSGNLGEIKVPNHINGTVNLSNSSTIDSLNHAWFWLRFHLVHG